jgi:alpha-L-rhamnosidase
MDHSKKKKEENRQNRREFLLEITKVTGAVGLAGSLPTRAFAQSGHMVAPENATAFSSLSPELLAGWLNPAHTYRPHTRWWWPGNAVTKEGIIWELDQMHQQGMGGVEIMSPWRMYAKGNISYLSKEFVDIVKFAIEQAERRDMEVAITFGAGWKFGGFWVPPTHRSKVLTQGSVDVQGPGAFDQELPGYMPPPTSRYLKSNFHSDAPDENQIVAVVAGKISGDRLDADSLVDLTSKVEKNHLRWGIPAGRWRLMAFRLKYTGEQNATTEGFPRRQWVVDHFSKEAVRNYCEYLGGTFYQAFGEQFGKTLDTFFCDSFEIMVLPETIHWSNAALEQFKAYKGYDLARYLPAVWWDIGELTPKIRYDVNDFLGWLGLDATFMSFIDWCGNHNVEARIQPYFRFTNEVIQGAGMTPRPEMEVTTDRFAVVLNPRKSVAAGGHLYGRGIISAESYTFLHMERYRTTLEQLKGATDAFLRDGVTQFYNHGYIYSPEMQAAPSRDMPWANRISHWNIWWKHYHHLADYVSRCCFLLRQGEFAGDVLIYSPQSMVWTEKVLFGNGRRILPYGNLGKTLVADGYDFDPVNDDVLQNRAKVEKGRVKVRDLTYRFLILPRTTAVPVATLEFIRQFVLGGGVIVALDELPSASVGLKDYVRNDTRVKEIVAELFGPDGKGKAHPGGGRTYFLADYKIPSYETTRRNYSPGPHPYEPTPALTAPQRSLLAALREHLEPDFVLAGNKQSNGLTFLHRRLGSDDIYFVTNLQPEASDTTVTFRVSGKVPERWDPMTGKRGPVDVYRAHAKGVEIPIHLDPYGSTLFIFRSGDAPAHLSETNLDEVRELNESDVKGVAGQNGEMRVSLVKNGQKKTAKITVSDLPKPLEVTGTWQMVLEGHGFERLEKQVSQLQSWTEDSRTEHFSGTGRYALDFHVPTGYVSEELETVLDLGAVGNVAEVSLNGRPVGVAWMRPYRLEVTEALKSGSNHLEVLVTNTLINYVSGMKELQGVPEELVPHYGPTVNIYHEGTAEWEHREKGFHPLPPSGLIGPVRIIARRKVTISI